MALIKCPECNHDMSSFAEKCPNCGFPNRVEEYKKYNVILNFVTLDNRREARAYLENKIGIDTATAMRMMMKYPSFVAQNVSADLANKIKDDLVKVGCEITISECKADIDSATDLKMHDTGIHCPKCGSTAITTGARGFSIWSGLVGSGKTVNRCAKCGNSWQPK